MQYCKTCPNQLCPFRTSEVEVSGFSLFINGCKISYRGEQVFDLSFFVGGEPIMRLRKSEIETTQILPEQSQLAS
ncbi:MAG: hypothetical protein AAFO04_24880 [Cyanobacteria bacterium J06592_8]